MTGGFGRPHCDICAASKLGARAPLRCERSHAIIAKHGRRTVRGLPQEVVVIFVEGLDDLLDVLKQMAPVLVLLSTTAILWWRSAHVARCELAGRSPAGT